MSEQLIELIDGKDFAGIKRMLEERNSTDLAQLMNELQPDKIPPVFRLLPKELAADTFIELDTDMQEHLIASFSDHELQEMLGNLFLDDMVDLVEEMPANVVERLLAQSTPIKRKLINELLKYPEDSAGSIMTVEFVNLKAHMTVLQAFDRIRKTGVNKETIYTCYVTDDKRVLIGVVSARNLLLAGQDDVIGDIMEENVIFSYTLDDQEDVARKISKYGFLAMPIVDKEKRLVGIVTVDDAMDVIEEENEEDFSKMAAIAPIEASYFKTSVWRHSRSRIVWLLILMITATITGLIINRFENALEAVPLLFSFVPMLMDTGGNCGSQSSTTIIRGLAVGEITPKDFFKVTLKESRIAVICSLILAVVNTLRIFIMYLPGARYENNLIYGVSIVLALTLVFVVLLSKLLGAALPLLAKKLKLDPALLASPVITTIVDAAAVLVYFGFVYLFMPFFGVVLS